MKKSYLLVAILFFVLVLSVFSYQDYLRNESELKNEKETSSKKNKKDNEKGDAIKELCSSFASNFVPVSCTQAANKALKEYPGTLKGVEFDTSFVKMNSEFSESVPEEKEVKILFWIIEIKMKEKFEFKGDKIEEVEIKVNAHNGEISPYNYRYFNKIEK